MNFKNIFYCFNERSIKDRASSILIIIVAFMMIIRSQSEFIEIICETVGAIAFISEIVWCSFFLPKRPNAPQMSKSEGIVFLSLGVIGMIYMIMRLSFSQLLPDWCDTALWAVLFGGLTFFALSTPTYKAVK